MAAAAPRRMPCGPARRALAAAMLAFFASSCAGGGGPATADGEPPDATVVRIVDGDTLVIDSAGEEDRVRLIGIDTPESVKPGTPVECFAKEASRHLAEILPEGTPLRLERDAEARDRYDRLLAYVYRASDGLFVNHQMVVDGYAQPVTYPPNVAHTDELVAAGRTAREQDLGLWGACGGDDPFG